MRRLTILLVVAFAAGPAMNLECLLSCASARTETRTDPCHASATPGATVSTPAACGETEAHLSPFIRSVESPSVAVSDASVSRSPLIIDIAVTRLDPLRLPGTGPPDHATLVPLRI